MTARGSPAFTAIGYGLIMLAGLIMLIQSIRPAPADHDAAHTLTGVPVSCRVPSRYRCWVLPGPRAAPS